MNRIHKNTGFTLIEVMVAMFILTIGMHGSTSMMLRSQQNAQETNIETTAAQRVWNVAELLRSNITNVNDPATNFDSVTVSTAGTAPACISTGCTGSQLIELTTYLIGIELDTYMPNKNPELVITDISNVDEDAIFNVTLTWDENKKDGATFQKQYEMIFQP